MHLAQPIAPEPARPEPRASGAHGWAAERQGKFLLLLAETGNVRVSVARCGMSAQSAYKLKRRQPLFARAWAAALILARDHCEQIVADRALDGIEEPVFYRGEQIGVRRRYDTRLLLAHMARLDRQADEAAIGRDAACFDELLALVAGESLPADWDDLPPGRNAHAAAAAEAAVDELEGTLPRARNAAARHERDVAIVTASDAARDVATRAWDEWFARACDRVDRLGQVPQPLHQVTDSPLLARPGLRAWTASTVSTASLAQSLAKRPAREPDPARSCRFANEKGRGTVKEPRPEFLPLARRTVSPGWR